MVRISESEYLLEDGKKGKLAVFFYDGSNDPYPVLNNAIERYVGDNDYYMLMDSQMNCPWMRVVLSNINDMFQEDFDENRHRLLFLNHVRKKKLQKINSL